MKHASKPPVARPAARPRTACSAAAAALPDPADAIDAAADDAVSRDERIHRLAYARWMDNGCMHGHALDDWLAAEAEVCGRAAGPGSEAGDGRPCA